MSECSAVNDAVVVLIYAGLMAALGAWLLWYLRPTVYDDHKKEKNRKREVDSQWRDVFEKDSNDAGSDSDSD